LGLPAFSDVIFFFCSTALLRTFLSFSVLASRSSFSSADTVQIICMLGSGEVGGSRAFSSRPSRPTRLGGIFSPDGSFSASSTDDVVDGDLDGDLGLGGVLFLSLLGEGDAVGLLRAGEQDGVAVFGRLERLEPSCLYTTFLPGDWGVLIRGDGDLWRLRAGDLGLGCLSRL